MLGIDGKHFRCERPVLVDLGRELDKVALHTAHGVIVDIAHEGMEGMAELMEHCLHVVYGLERRAVG